MSQRLNVSRLFVSHQGPRAVPNDVISLAYDKVGRMARDVLKRRA
jgi:hypothetical protein